MDSSSQVSFTIVNFSYSEGLTCWPAIDAIFGTTVRKYLGQEWADWRFFTRFLFGSDFELLAGGTSEIGSTNEKSSTFIPGYWSSLNSGSYKRYSGYSHQQYQSQGGSNSSSNESEDTSSFYNHMRFGNVGSLEKEAYYFGLHSVYKIVERAFSYTFWPIKKAFNAVGLKWEAKWNPCNLSTIDYFNPCVLYNSHISSSQWSNDMVFNSQIFGNRDTIKNYLECSASHYIFKPELIHKYRLTNLVISDYVSYNVDDFSNEVKKNIESNLNIISHQDHDNIELYIIIDTSGSMGTNVPSVGKNRLSMAKDTLFLMLHSLYKNTYLNIVEFNTNFQAFLLESVTNSESKIEILKNKVKALIEGGGTNLHGPLLYTLQKGVNSSHKKVIFILTDGDAEDQNKVEQLLNSRSNNDINLYTFGIGNDVKIDFLKRIATKGNGKFYHIENIIDMNAKIIDALSVATKRKISDDQKVIKFENVREIFTPKKERLEKWFVREDNFIYTKTFDDESTEKQRTIALKLDTKSAKSEFIFTQEFSEVAGVVFGNSVVQSTLDRFKLNAYEKLKSENSQTGAFKFTLKCSYDTLIACQSIASYVKGAFIYLISGSTIVYEQLTLSKVSEDNSIIFQNPNALDLSIHFIFDTTFFKTVAKSVEITECGLVSSQTLNVWLTFEDLGGFTDVSEFTKDRPSCSKGEYKVIYNCLIFIVILSSILY